MAKRPRPPAKGEPALETTEFVEAWARDLVVAVGKRQARKVLDDYERLAADKQLSAFDRAVAK